MARFENYMFTVQKAGLPAFCAGEKCSYESSYLSSVNVLAHNLIHKRCAEHRQAGKTRRGASVLITNLCLPRFYAIGIFL
jgi:hypothetical protein